MIFLRIIPAPHFLHIFTCIIPNLTFFYHEDRIGQIFDQPAIMGDENNGAGIIFQRLFQGDSGIYVQMVGRFIQYQYIDPGKQQFCQGDSTPLADT